jgi:hypothetical protein
VSGRRRRREWPPRNSINPGASQRPCWITEPAEQHDRFVLHVPFFAADIGAAFKRAGLVADVFMFLPDFDRGESTVTYEGDQINHYRVICDRPFPNGTRCLLHRCHSGECRPA